VLRSSRSRELWRQKGRSTAPPGGPEWRPLIARITGWFAQVSDGLTVASPLLWLAGRWLTYAGRWLTYAGRWLTYAGRWLTYAGRWLTHAGRWLTHAGRRGRGGRRGRRSGHGRSRSRGRTGRGRIGGRSRNRRLIRSIHDCFAVGGFHHRSRDATGLRMVAASTAPKIRPPALTI
jgi:hypothetical protein